MAEDFPYTDEQKQAFYWAASRHVVLDDEDTALILLGLHDAGITVTFPEPRYTADNDDGFWTVWDRGRPFGRNWTAQYGDSHPDPEAAAKAEAQRLNEAT